MLEEAIDQQHRDEVAGDDPRGQPRRRPQAEQLIGEEDERKQHNRHPLIAKPARPGKARMNKPPHEVAREHERARHAEEVARHEDHEHQRPAKMHPGQHRCQILRRDRRPEEAVQNHYHADQQQRNLQQSSRVPPHQKTPDHGNKQQIERRGLDHEIVVEIVRRRRIGQGCRHLVRPDAPHVHLTLDLSPIGEFDMKQHHPVAAHIEVDLRPVTAGSCFLRRRRKPDPCRDETYPPPP